MEIPSRRKGDRGREKKIQSHCRFGGGESMGSKFSAYIPQPVKRKRGGGEGRSVRIEEQRSTL